MAAFCEFYHYTPDQFWGLRMDGDYQALARRMNQRAREQEKG